MKITCITAFKMEAAWLLSRLTDTRKFKIGRMRTWSGRLGPHELSFLVCGAGPDKARQSLEGCSSMLQQAERIFHLGVCGALHRGIPRYRALIAETVAATYEPERGPIRLDDLDQELLESLEPAQIPARGRILTHPFPVFSSRLRNDLHLRFDADCVEMEAWEIAAYCRRKDIPLTVVKAVSDYADLKSAENFPVHARKAAQAAGQVMLAVLRAL